MQETTRQELQDSQERLLAAQVEADRNAYKLQQAGAGSGQGKRAGKEVPKLTHIRSASATPSNFMTECQEHAMTS